MKNKLNNPSGTKHKSKPKANKQLKKSNKKANFKIHWRQGMGTWLAGIKPINGDKLTKTLDPAVEHLCRRLFGIGGESVCGFFIEPPQIHMIIANLGHIMTGNGAKLKRGQPSRCHENVAEIWKHNQSKFTIYTGYGLSEDGMWRRHSWLVDKKLTIIETTAERELYYGIPLREEGGDAFCKMYANIS